MKSSYVVSSLLFLHMNVHEAGIDPFFSDGTVEKFRQTQSGVKFNIQRDSNSKIIQQPKDDALTNCATEHLTKILVCYLSPVGC